MLESVEQAPPDAILGLTEAFKKDQNPLKINLGVGVYKDEHGATPTLEVVQEAEAALVVAKNPKLYMPITGSPAYGVKVREMLFGEGHAVVGDGRSATAHTPGGTGALRVGADFLRFAFPGASVWMSRPTWANHKGIFAAAGFQAREYAYYDAATKALDFEGMMNDLRGVPAGDIVLLHVCCHNPTGVDLTMEQWKAVADLASENGWMPFLDFAYQGFGDSLEEDRKPIGLFLENEVELFIASSFSKNFGLYQDRVGALTFIAKTAEAAGPALSQVKRLVRTNYSNPPAHGSHIVEHILNDASLQSRWVVELAAMRDRIKAMRSALVDGLKERGVAGDYSFINRQRGMFSFSGLSDEQVQFLREKKSIYIVKGGRINVAGITPANAAYLCDSIAEAL